MVDPIIAKAVAQHIAQAFAAVDPANAASYNANYKKFEATIDAKLQDDCRTYEAIYPPRITIRGSISRTALASTSRRFSNQNPASRRRPRTSPRSSPR